MVEQSIDRRVRRSRRAMLGAFDRLLEVLPFEKITVSDIAREADVDRKTFYQHFGTVDNLLDTVAEYAASELLDEAERHAAERAEAGEEETLLTAFYFAVVTRLSRNVPLSKHRWTHVPAELLLDRLARPLIREGTARGFITIDTSDGRLEAMLSFWLGGLLSMYRWWLASDREIPLSELTELASRIIDPNVELLAG